MKAQEDEFRQQLDALRGKFQSLYKEGIESQKEKVRDLLACLHGCKVQQNIPQNRIPSGARLITRACI